MTQLSIPSFGGDMIESFLATPAGGHGAGLILLDGAETPPERLSAQCEDFAAMGYLTLCPLITQKQAPTFDHDRAVGDLLSMLAFLRKQPNCSGKVGAVGFGLGGLMAFLLAARSDVDVAVACGSPDLTPSLGEVHDIRMPFLALCGEQTDPLKAATAARVARSLGRNKMIAVHTYAGVDDSFFRVEHASFNAEAARDAHEKTLAFLGDQLNH
ncbi:MAG: dienelactone hydrolase family protein [Bdellovibrionales bacterium]|jgi:carboxymethylenebutenolidase